MPNKPIDPSVITAFRAKNDFDAMFTAATARFWGLAFDPTALKAQGWVESALCPKATSPSGASGIMQFMPETWKEAKTLIQVSDIFNPEENIMAGAWYMRRLWDEWEQFKQHDEIYRFALASYNAGAGNIHKALILCMRDPFLAIPAPNRGTWATVSDYLEQVTGHENSIETIDYVNKITSILVLVRQVGI